MKRVGILSLIFVLAGCQSQEQSHFEKIAAEYPAAQAAASKAGVPLHCRELTPPILALEDNAAPLLAQAAAQFKGLRFSQDALTLLRATDTASRAQAAEMVEKARRGIDLAVAASEKKGLDYGREWDTDQPWNIQFPEYSDLRTAAKWVCARALVRARAGDHQGALSDLLAVIKLGEFAGSEPTLISGLVSIGIDAVATRQIEWLVSENPSHITQIKNLQLALRLQENSRPFSFYMKGDAVLSIAFAEGWSKISEEDRNLFAVFNDDPIPRPPSGISEELVGRAYATRALQVWTEAFEAMKRKDFKLSPSEPLEKIEARIASSNDPTYLWSKITMPVFSQAGNAFIGRLARVRAVEGMLAAVSYWQARGKMPGTLEDAGFKEVDPFTGKALRYKATKDSVTIWSVGQDLKDDGATEKENKDIVARFPRD